jgi:hypothetical protein
VSTVIRKKALPQMSIFWAAAHGDVATGVGVASASTHATLARALTSVTANAKKNFSSSTPMPLGALLGISGDVTATSVTASTMVTRNEQSVTFANVLIGDIVQRTVCPTNPTLASTIDIVPASVVAKISQTLIIARGTFNSSTHSVDATTVGSGQLAVGCGPGCHGTLDERNRQLVQTKFSGPGRSLPSARVLK